jgi:hypothetical protein
VCLVGSKIIGLVMTEDFHRVAKRKNMNVMILASQGVK